MSLTLTILIWAVIFFVYWVIGVFVMTWFYMWFYRHIAQDWDSFVELNVEDTDHVVILCATGLVFPLVLFVAICVSVVVGFARAMQSGLRRVVEHR